MASWSPYGGRINMPTIDKLARNGLTYSQFHTTALCSPTRSCFLTGRNHHLNGMSCITEGAQGYPGWSGRIPPQCATMAEILRDNGWGTFWLGKNHNVAEPDVAPGASRTEWPLRKGFDRFYGFLGGETNQWFPDLVEDNRFIDHRRDPVVHAAVETVGNQRHSRQQVPRFQQFAAQRPARDSKPTAPVPRPARRKQEPSDVL